MHPAPMVDAPKPPRPNRHQRRARASQMLKAARAFMSKRKRQIARQRAKAAKS